MVAAASSAEVRASALPGTTGTPTSMASARAATLSPNSLRAGDGGPTKVMPLAAHCSAKSEFSETKP